MAIPGSIIDAQLERLLQIVDDYKTSLHEQIVTKVVQEKSLIIKSAYRDSRSHLHDNIEEIRKRYRREISAANARQGTLVKQREHADNIRFLHQAWDLIEEKLLERWCIAEQRKAWIDKVTHHAFRLLPPGSWRIEHPVDWLNIEKDALSNFIHQRIDNEPTFISDQNIKAGVRFGFSGATVDGTLQGLLADQARINAEMLARAMDIRAGKGRAG